MHIPIETVRDFLETPLRALIRNAQNDGFLERLDSDYSGTLSHYLRMPNIIRDTNEASVEVIDTNCMQRGIRYPSLDDLDNTSLPMDAVIRRESQIIIAACSQLSATVNLPSLELNNLAMSFHVPSSLRVAVSGNIVEILRDSGMTGGMHVNEIATKNGMLPGNISRVLRTLATYHVFREVTPDVFTNNRLSLFMDSGKSLEELHVDPVSKHLGTSGFAALIEASTDEMFKGSAYMLESMKAGAMPGVTPLNIAFGNGLNFWDWLDRPQNELRLKRFNIAMNGMATYDHPDAILKGFDWSSLPPSSTVVDVGGGLGHLAMRIYQEHPTLKFIIQDRPVVIAQAQEYWKTKCRSALDSGAVRLQSHNFFDTQPCTNASIFLIRYVIHNYPKDSALAILQHLRNAAQKDTKLLIVDMVAPYACYDPSPPSELKGYDSDPVPSPLLANLGKANAMSYLLDLQMYIPLQGEERTVAAFVELAAEARWKIVEIFTIPGASHKQLLAIPV